MRPTFEDTLAELIRPEVEAIGCRLWGLTSPSKGQRRIIRIYIDGHDGVTIDQCAEVSRQVGLLLEVEDIIPGAFILEVSSPGMDRRFFSTAQMNDYTGSQVAALLHEARDGRRKVIGTLVRVDETEFTVKEDGQETTLAWNDLKEVRIVPEF
ncbi:ribosome maturation factor RimP [Pseudodesulfovibrio sp. F-1]|uniref:Ribosome maturation factor RimP n=1 Tax=Pseudodesulfovibrio alkaliphilus TaxID=2661613 RepID=A0A7K1KJ27_9BACT|nr:ribosome maturation factor RimP [Pseudodesulfovibrio alkaliphilus]MUM76056.1 ribosome maturation factor RimP [Pseudodesulfovibrio alkaliphilus]